MTGQTFPANASVRRLPNLFDVAAIICIGGLVFAFASGARHTVAPLTAMDAINLDPSYLPGYALRTTLRMFAALACSVLFTFTYATWAAKSRRAGKVLVPVLDILQSVPIIGFLTFTVVFFMGLFPGRVLGVELAAIFAIFTSQAWNMAFSLYQSLKTVPVGSGRVRHRVPPVPLAEILAHGGALRHARAGVEHHDVDVRRLVLRRRQRGRDRRGHHLEAAGHRVLRGAGAGGPQYRRGLLRHRGDAGGDPRLRSIALPPPRRLVGEIPVRDDGRCRSGRSRGS